MTARQNPTSLVLAAGVATCLAAPAGAAGDGAPLLAPAPAPSSGSSPTVGLGVTFSFGGDQGIDTGIGERVFSTNRRNRAAATIGLDYMITSQRWRGTLGAAYLRGNGFVGLDVGVGLADGALDFGASVGAAGTRRAPAGVRPPIGGGAS